MKREAGQSCSYRILVVDDNVDSAESTALLLQLDGHEVRMAHDGSSTLEICRAFQPQVILLDIGLPGMDGFTTAQRLREDLQMHETVLIALTGYGQPEDRERSRKAGFDHHLVKPINPKALQALIVSLGSAGLAK